MVAIDTDWRRRAAARLLIVCLVIVAARARQVGGALMTWAAAGTFKAYTYKGPAGSRAYAVYTPAGYTTKARVPLIVILHGCGQGAVDIARGTRMNDLADVNQFIAVYPQESGTNMNCWQWFLSADQSRGSGEPAIIAGITQAVMQNPAAWNIDPRRVYITGMSAGAAMSVVMGATYPDLYAAIGEESGTEYAPATDWNGAVNVCRYGGPDPVNRGQAAYTAMGAHARTLPVIAFQGTADSTVNPVNGDQVLEQWMETDYLASAGSDNGVFGNPSTTVQGKVPGTSGRAYTVRKWNDASGTEVQEYWTVSGMSHAWSGGSTAGSYTDPNGPSASQNMYTFFMAHPH